MSPDAIIVILLVVFALAGFLVGFEWGRRHEANK